jgi:hypothetical protein
LSLSKFLSSLLPEHHLNTNIDQTPYQHTVMQMFRLNTRSRFGAKEDVELEGSAGTAGTAGSDGGYVDHILPLCHPFCDWMTYGQLC